MPRLIQRYEKKKPERVQLTNLWFIRFIWFAHRAHRSFEAGAYFFYFAFFDTSIINNWCGYVCGGTLSRSLKERYRKLGWIDIYTHVKQINTLCSYIDKSVTVRTIRCMYIQVKKKTKTYVFKWMTISILTFSKYSWTMKWPIRDSIYERIGGADSYRYITMNHIYISVYIFQ